MPNSTGKLDAITLDVGNTLVFPQPSLEHIYRSVAEKHELMLDTSFGEEAFAKAWRQEQQHRNGKLVYGTTHEEALDFWLAVNRIVFHGKTVSESRLQRFVEDLYFTFGRGTAWRITHELQDLIAACRLRRMRVAILSNWDMRLRGILSDLGLLAVADATIISAEHGVEKPDAEIFRRATSQLGVAPERTLHVGDTWEDDVVGAITAGLRAAWLNPDAEPIPDETIPVHVITNLSELIPLL